MLRPRGDAQMTVFLARCPMSSKISQSVHGLHGQADMVSTATVDLPLSAVEECLPPPIPTLARVPRRRRARPATLSPGMKIGVWRVEAELGRGGMASVYAVVHSRFGKRAALKLAHRSILGPQFTPDVFLREARTANLIDDAGIPDVFATGTFDGRPYIVMERLSGRSLGAHLNAQALPRDEAFEILIEVCEVLATAASKGVTHRDLKLENVFLLDAPGPGGRRTKLLDWGVACIANEPDPLHGLIAGTLTYVAPEQVRGEPITPAADVYSLGVLAYQLLLGQPPFAAASDLELVHKHLKEAPPNPADLWPEISPELAALLVRMLAKEPDARPSLAEIIEELRAARWPALPEPEIFELTMPGPDVLGRPVIFGTALTRARRVLGAVLGLGIAVACLASRLAG
jgi:serine/threonine protein kinase